MLIHSLLLLVGFILLKTFAEVYRCLTVSYNNEIQGCCYGIIYNLKQDSVEYACCTSANKIYKKNEQSCCGNEIRNKTDGLVCCENHFRRSEEGMCCGDIFHVKRNELRDKCCGKKVYNYHTKDYLCCQEKLHNALPGEICCGSETYNRATQWCKNKREPLRYGSDICGKEEYITATHVCCKNVHVQKKMHLTDDGCCGSTSYNSTKYICENDRIVDRTLPFPSQYKCGDKMIDNRNQSCCKNKTAYDPLNEKCCGGIVIQVYEKCCDGKRVDTQSFTCCINESRELQSRKSKPEHDECCILNNGSTETYNSIDSRCFLGKVVINGHKCGPDGYNPTTDLCCQGVLKERGRLKNMNCCGVDAYDVRKGTCEGSKIRQKPMCGLRVYDKNKDLCCSEVPIKNGLMLNKTCECPHYCQHSWLVNTTSWENEITKINCDYKDYRISKVNDTKWITKARKPQKKVIWFKEDCSCINGSQNSLILLAKKVTKKGEIKGKFYVLPDRKYFKKSVKLLKQGGQINCNRKNNRRKDKI